MGRQGEGEGWARLAEEDGVGEVQCVEELPTTTTKVSLESSGGSTSDDHGSSKIGGFAENAGHSFQASSRVTRSAAQEPRVAAAAWRALCWCCNDVRSL